MFPSPALSLCVQKGDESAEQEQLKPPEGSCPRAGAEPDHLQEEPLSPLHEVCTITPHRLGCLDGIYPDISVYSQTHPMHIALHTPGPFVLSMQCYCKPRPLSDINLTVDSLEVFKVDVFSLKDASLYV